MNRNHLNNFERGPTKDHSCEVWSNSHQWFRRRCCLKIVDRRTSGRRQRRRRRRRTVSDHNSSPLAFGSGELKTHLFKSIANFTSKNWKFSDKNSIFHISVQNIDCGYSWEPPRRGGSNKYPQSMFLSRNNEYPRKPQFYYIKVEFKGVKIIQVCFPDEKWVHSSR